MSLKSKRIEKGFTQGEAAEKCGITQGRLSHYETGIRQPKPMILKKLSQVYNCTIDELIGDNDDEAGIGKGA